MDEQDIQIYILTQLQEKKENVNKKIAPIYTDVGVDRETFAKVVEDLERKKFISDAKVQRAENGDAVEAIFLQTAHMESLGEDFLKSHL